MDKNIKIEADGNFPFTFYIEKAIAGGTEELMTIKGVASTVNLDHDNERMSEESLRAMADIINEKSVPLRVEHQKDDQSIVGSVNKAWVDARNQLWIEADLDKSHPGASMLYKALKTGAKLGLSVGGRVKHAVKEFSESAGRMVKTFYNVVLDEVSVTSRPANYDAWLVSKSIISKEEDGEHFVDSPIYKEFLFENSGFDYMQAFAKSIPDNSWKKVDISKNNENINMTKKEEEEKKESKETTEETKEKAQETETETEKAETKDETETKETEKAFKSMVTKGLEGLTKAMAKLMKGTDDTTIMPDKKDETETETKEKTTKENETETKEKAETKDETETKEKAESSSETAESKEKDSDYQIKSMKSILKKIEDLSKAIDDSETETKTKEKSEKKEDESETTEKSLDAFVATIEKSINDLQEKFEKGGKRFPGLTEMIVNSIRNDAEVQKEIKSMMGETGFKKSMNFGVPTMRTKDGKSYRLTAVSMDEEVTKSKKDNAGKTFKDVYNKDFSSSANAGE